MQSPQDNNDQREVFLSLIAHELKTPLTTIQGFTQVLHRKTAQKLARYIPNPIYGKDELEKQLESVETMMRQIQRMTRLIDDITDITTMKQEIRNFTPHEVDVYSVLKNVIERVDSMKDSMRSITLNSDCDRILVSGDEGKLEQLFSNIVANAMKFSPDNSPIVIDCSSSGANIKITVTDQGIGISETDLPYVFELYYRGAEISSRKVSGLGLGLYLSKKIVELHKGNIEITSQEKGGTQVHVYIPLKESTINT